MEFPRLVYKSPSEYVCVSDIYDYDAAITSGWFPDVMSAKQDCAPALSKSISEPVIDRSALEEKAKSLNIKFDGRTTNTKLVSLIDKALES